MRCAVLLSVALGATSFLPGRGVSHDGVVAALLVIMVLKACSQQMCFPTSMVRAPAPHPRGTASASCTPGSLACRLPRTLHTPAAVLTVPECTIKFLNLSPIMGGAERRMLGRCRVSRSL